MDSVEITRNYLTCLRQVCPLFSIITFLAHSKNELMQWRGVRRLSVCKLLRKSLLLVDRWPDRDQTCTRWSPGEPASRVCSRSRSRSKVTWYAHFLRFLKWATPSMTVWLMILSCWVSKRSLTLATVIKWTPSVSHVLCSRLYRTCSDLDSWSFSITLTCSVEYSVVILLAWLACQLGYAS